MEMDVLDDAPEEGVEQDGLDPRPPRARWLRLSAEIVAIVASILLAFGIDAWWESRQRAVEAHALLAGLETEVSENLVILRAGIDSLEANQDRLGRFLTTPVSAYAVELGDSAWHVSIRPHYRDYSVTLSYGFLDATISAGKLELIDDAQLRADLAGLRGLQETADEPLRPLVDLTSEAGVILGEHPAIRRGVGSDEYEFDGDSGAVLRALRTDLRLVRLANARAILTSGYISGLSVLEDGLERVLRTLDSAQSP